MCGLVGVASYRSLDREQYLSQRSALLNHRGPDSSGEWWSDNGKVGMAHRRLSIIDVSTDGHQPMNFPELGLTLVFNGEIYNYKELRTEIESKGFVFRSSSDTEVLLLAYHIWGIECVKKLNGMFAFAIYDDAAAKLMIARDRVGEKPLFYHFNGETLHFSSELKALIAHPELPKKIDPLSFDCLLSMGYIPSERCILEGYNKLAAGHVLDFDLKTSGLSISQYWDLPPYAKSGMSDQDLITELGGLLKDSVQRQLVADVPVGVLLSGGVDSSIITALASQCTKKVKTFTIGMPGDKRLDETPHARLISNHFGTEHVELNIQSNSVTLLQDLAKQFDEPIIDSSMIPTYLVSNLVKKHCTVALGGDGGDELFGGYSHYRRMLWVEQGFRWIPHAVRGLVSFAASKSLAHGMKGRNWLQGLGEDLGNGVPQIANYFDPAFRRKLIPNVNKNSLVAEEIRRSYISSDSDLLQRATRLDFKTYLAEDILVKVDRASMMNSLEVRAPFLDYRLIEFAFAKIPSHLKATTKSSKIALKMLAAKLLPDEFDFNRKQGFSIPLSQWLAQGEYRELFHDVLLDSNSIFDKVSVEALFSGQDKGRNNSERLFGLLMFELWRKEYGCHL